MKKILSVLYVLLMIVSVAFTCIDCKKDDSCKVRIICRFTETGVDTGAVVPNCDIIIGEKNTAAYAKAEGKTNSNGVFEHTFKLPALLDVKATDTITLKDGSKDYYLGTAQVKLEPGETVEKVVLLQKIL